MSDLLDLLGKMKQPMEREAVLLIERIKREPQALVSREFYAPVSAEDRLSGKKAFFTFGFGALGRIERIELPWSEKLEGELYSLKVALDRPEQEAIRGATLILSNLQWPDLKYGKDFSDNVLCAVVKERFSDVEPVREVLDKIPFHKVSSGRNSEDCISFIKSSINGYGNSLVMQLGYKNEKAFPILVVAVMYVLDQRFSISLKNALFPKS